MILAVSQDATGVNVFAGSNANYNEDDLLDYTFDNLYVSSTDTTSFFIDLFAQDTTYIGIAGHNLGTLGASIDILNHDSVDINSFIPADDRPIMLVIPPRSGGAVNAVRVRITKPNLSDGAIITHLATGLVTDFTSTTVNGQVMIKDYESGFNKIPMNIGVKSKAVLNSSAAPTATLIQTVSQKVTLKISSVATSFVQNELVGYQRFWIENAFFIQNDDDITQTYMAMQFVPLAPRAHAQTRNLTHVSYKFIAYNGL
jgi:hypothetical protein